MSDVKSNGQNGKIVLLRPDVMSMGQMLAEVAADHPDAEAVIVVVFDKGVMSMRGRGVKSELLALGGAMLLKHACP